MLLLIHLFFIIISLDQVIGASLFWIRECNLLIDLVPGYEEEAYYKDDLYDWKLIIVVQAVEETDGTNYQLNYGFNRIDLFVVYQMDWKD